MLGTTLHGEVVEINRRAAESDLLIYVNINLVTMDGGHKSVPVGLATYRSVRHHHNADDAARFELHGSAQQCVSSIVRANGRGAFEAVEGVHDRDDTEQQHLFEPSWFSAEARTGVEHPGSADVPRESAGIALPGALRRRAYTLLPSAYGLTGVHAGATEAVHAATLGNVDRQYEVAVPSQFDIVLVGLPSIGPYNVDSVLNPILVQCLSTGYFFNFYRHRPLVRRGGVMIVDHPLENEFHLVHHPSYFDFFNDLLPQTRESG